MKLDHCLKLCLACLLLGMSLSARGAFHLWQITEVYSNADGSVQFIELTALAGGQQFLTGHQIRSIQGSQTRTYSFTTDLPGDSAGRTFLIATQGFAALGIVSVDYVVPNNFLFTSNASINFADADIFSYASLPTNGTLSLNRDGSTSTNSPKNFAGSTATVSSADYSGAWYNANESGWGLSIIRGASGAYGIIMYNFNATRNPTWYFMAGGSFSGNVYTGPINFYSGTPFNESFNASQLTVTPVGNVTITFSSTTAGTINYTLNGATVTRNITKIAF